MNSRLIELAQRLALVGPRLRGLLGQQVLQAVWRLIVVRGREAPPAMPLRPDPRVSSYWTKRSRPLQPRERYREQY